MNLSVPEPLRAPLAKPVAVFGGGVSGEGVRTLLATIGAREVVYDAKGTVFTAADVPRHALAVFSPGFAPDHSWLRLAREGGVECLGELDFASLFWKGAVVAITGTNGKTTLTEFLTHALRHAGRDAHATGNIGHSFSQVVVELRGGAGQSVAVCEVSSFQAETLRHLQPDATLWTNLAEDHLERHPGLRGYFDAKWVLAARTKPAGAGTGVFLGSSVVRWAGQLGVSLGQATGVETEGRPADPRLAGTVFADYPQRENFLLAHAWWRSAGLDESLLLEAARSFRLGRHRLTRVAEIGGVTYWNDSKGTNFHAVEAALGRFTTPVVLIAGGKPKGGDLRGFVTRIAPRVAHVVLIGATGPELARYCAELRVPHTPCPSLGVAVQTASSLAPRGGHVLLSPGFASFDQFRNYEDRGEQFEEFVRELARHTAVASGVSAPRLR